MEKLIELLNEYEGQDTWSYDEEMGMPYYGWGDDCDYEAYLISKKYGFIKWLVENDKIDTQNLITYMNGTSLTFNKVPSTDCVSIDKTWNNFYTECLLMLLAISSSPIEDLISYLK